MTSNDKLAKPASKRAMCSGEAFLPFRLFLRGVRTKNLQHFSDLSMFRIYLVEDIGSLHELAYVSYNIMCYNRSVATSHPLAHPALPLRPRGARNQRMLHPSLAAKARPAVAGALSAGMHFIVSCAMSIVSAVGLTISLSAQLVKFGDHQLDDAALRKLAAALVVQCLNESTHACPVVWMDANREMLACSRILSFENLTHLLSHPSRK
jgi:hypothetical protein